MLGTLNAQAFFERHWHFQFEWESPTDNQAVGRADVLKYVFCWGVLAGTGVPVIDGLLGIAFDLRSNKAGADGPKLDLLREVLPFTPPPVDCLAIAAENLGNLFNGAHALTPLRRSIINRASAGLMGTAALLLARTERAA